MVLGIPGSGYAESRLLGGKSLGIFEEVTSALGLNAGNAPVLMMLGDVKFSLNTAAFLEINRTTQAQWASVSQYGKLDAMQYTGPGPDILEMPGTIYPDWKGSAQTLDTLRKMQRAGEVYFLIDTNGNVLGLFVIMSIREGRTQYKANGEPRRVTFTLSLRRFAEISGQQNNQAQDGSGIFGGVKKFVGKIEAGIRSVENDMKDAVGSAVDSIRKTLD